MTVAFSGLPTITQGANCELTFASNFGSGAAGVARSPGGCDVDDEMCVASTTPCVGNTYAPSDRGPLTDILLTDGGSCYARLGRVPPTLTAQCDSGTGAEFTITLIENVECSGAHCAVWGVSGIAVKGGTGYSPESEVRISHPVGATKVVLATATLHTGLSRTEPAVTLAATGGTGAALTPIVEPVAWGISAISIAGGGSGYQYGAAVMVAASGATCISPTKAVIRTKLVEPTLSVAAPFTLTVSEQTYADGRKYWTVSSIAISGFTGGYSLWSPVAVTVDSGTVEVPLCATVSAVDGGGVPTSVTIHNGGRYFKDSGEIESVVVFEPGCYAAADEPALTVTAPGGSGASLNASVAPVRWGVTSCVIEDGGSGYAACDRVTALTGPSTTVELAMDCTVGDVDESGAIQSVCVFSAGRYYDYAGVPVGVTIESRGQYYEEDKDAPPYVADVRVGACGGGSDAQISATIGSDPVNEPASFGKIIALTIDDGGSNYLVWRWVNSCNDKINGKTFVLRAEYPEPLVKLCVKSCFGSGAAVDWDLRTRESSDATCQCAIQDGEEYYRYYDYNGLPSPLPGAWLIPNSSVDSTSGSGYAKLGREQPGITVIKVAGSPGSGATFTPTLSQKEDDCGLPYWEIESVTVTGGTCYGVSGRTKPTLSVRASGGSGATFTPLLYEDTDECGGKYWTLNAVSVFGGCGYLDGAPLQIVAPSGVTTITEAEATLSVSGDCDGISVNVTNGGKYFVPGPDESLFVVRANGEFQIEPASLTLQTDEQGVPSGVTVVKGGGYYGENPLLPPYIADVTVEVDQAAGSDGSGAEFSVSVDSDTSSPTFGSLLPGITLVDGGSDYTFYGASRSCTYIGGCNDRTCYGFGDPLITLTFPGVGGHPELRLGDAVFRAIEAVGDCNSPPGTAAVLHSIDGGTATITRGGVWQTGGTLCCGDKCAQVYMRDEEGIGCDSSPFNSVTFSCGEESATIYDYTPNSYGDGVGAQTTGIRIAGPWTYTCHDDSQGSVSVLGFIGFFANEIGFLGAGCGCGDCWYNVEYGCFFQGDGDPIGPFGLPGGPDLGSPFISFDRCNETTRSRSTTFFACEQQGFIESNIEGVFVQPGVRPTADVVCPPGFADDGEGGCYRDDDYFPFAICEGDPGYEAAVADGCQGMIGQQVEIVPGSLGTVTAGEPVDIGIPNCIACRYTVRTTAAKDACPEGFVSDGAGGCKGVGCYWDTWPQDYTDSEITLTINHNEPCDPPNCECETNPLP